MVLPYLRSMDRTGSCAAYILFIALLWSYGASAGENIHFHVASSTQHRGATSTAVAQASKVFHAFLYANSLRDEADTLSNESAARVAAQVSFWGVGWVLGTASGDMREKFVEAHIDSDYSKLIKDYGLPNYMLMNPNRRPGFEPPDPFALTRRAVLNGRALLTALIELNQRMSRAVGQPISNEQFTTGPLGDISGIRFKYNPISTTKVLIVPSKRLFHVSHIYAILEDGKWRMSLKDWRP